MISPASYHCRRERAGQAWPSVFSAPPSLSSFFRLRAVQSAPETHAVGRVAPGEQPTDTASVLCHVGKQSPSRRPGEGGALYLVRATRGPVGPTPASRPLGERAVRGTDSPSSYGGLPRLDTTRAWPGWAGAGPIGLSRPAAREGGPPRAPSRACYVLVPIRHIVSKRAGEERGLGSHALNAAAYGTFGHLGCHQERGTRGWTDRQRPEINPVATAPTCPLWALALGRQRRRVNRMRLPLLSPSMHSGKYLMFVFPGGHAFSKHGHETSPAGGHKHHARPFFSLASHSIYT